MPDDRLPPIREGDWLWSPTPAFVRHSQIRRYMDWLGDHGHSFTDYEALRRWSITDLPAFWGSLWRYFAVRSDAPYRQVLSGADMAHTRWFEGARVNYAEHLLRHEESAAPGETALHHWSECRVPGTVDWHALGRAVRILATQLRRLGVGPGDRVVSYLPNVPETAVAMMATTAIGAVWSSAAPEFGVKTVIDRFAQIEPRLLFAADGYRYAGKDHGREREVRQIVEALPSLERVVWLDYLAPGAPLPKLPKVIRFSALMDHPEIARSQFRYTRVASDHPLWIVFSSGTTGLPKAIVHGHAGVLVEHLKLMHFHLNLRPAACMFFYSTTGWMMWNILLAALLTGSSAVLYDGHPAYPGPDHLWQLASASRATCFGASPTYVQMMEKAGLKPGECFDLSALESIVVAGAPSTPETFDWFYRCVKRDLWVTSQSGGTELCSAFVGASPTLPVYAGEIQTRLLGMDVQSWREDGTPAAPDEVGELVVTKPFPSMPLSFWNDEGGRRYHEAYFATFPGIWRHGDFLKINARGGCYIYGRSDSTLNRNGVRIGTAEIYRIVEQLPDVQDSLIVCCEHPGGSAFMPLFVRLKPGAVLDDAGRTAINDALRKQGSPRHVPDGIYAVPDIPYTLTGKKMEIPVRRILQGTPLAKAASRDAMMNPSAIDWFVQFAQESIDYPWRKAAGVTGAPAG